MADEKKAEAKKAKKEPEEPKKIKKALLYGGYDAAVREAIATDRMNKRGVKSKKSALRALPSPEEIRQGVAEIVLKEMELWPEELVSAIGEQHPNADNFIKGVPYVIRAYMKIAYDTINRDTKAYVDTRMRETTRELGPLVGEIGRIKDPIIASRGKKVQELREEREKEIKSAVRRVKADFRNRINAVMQAPFPEELGELEARVKALQSAFEVDRDARTEARDAACAKIGEIEEAVGEYEREQERLRQEAARKKAEKKRAAQAKAAVAKTKKPKPQQTASA